MTNDLVPAAGTSLVHFGYNTLPDNNDTLPVVSNRQRVWHAHRLFWTLTETSKPRLLDPYSVYDVCDALLAPTLSIFYVRGSLSGARGGALLRHRFE